MLQYTYHNTMSTTSKHHLQHLYICKSDIYIYILISISQNSPKYVPLESVVANFY